MYNLRYHIASLVAVFLALAVGLLLGGLVVQNGLVGDQVKAQVSALQKEFATITAQSTAIKKTNDALTDFAGQTAPQLVANTLTGRTILVIASADTADTVAKVTQGVKAAGGTTAIATFSDPGLSLGDDGVTAAAGKALGIPASSVDETAVITGLAREWTATSDARTLTKALVSAGALKFTGLAANETVGGTVVSDTFDGDPDPVAFQLASAATPAGRFAVGVETTKRADGTAASAKAAGLSGVDDVDTPVGEVSLVWVLTGRASGLFGQGATVDSPFPTPLFPTP